jgi:TolB protein
MSSSRLTGEHQRLTHDGKLKFAPTFVHGDQELTFAVHEAPNLVAIKRLRLAGGAQERVHPGISDHQFDPAFSADGRYHCFAMSATSPQLVLVIQDTKEKSEAIFRPREARATARHPSIAPDGSRVVFALSDVTGHQIASVNLQGRDLKILAESAGMNAWPSLSPDGKRIAFASSRDGTIQIHVMSADGCQVRRLTKGPALNMRPSWSPDGRRLAFTSSEGGKYRIHIMNGDGSGLQLLAEGGERDDYPIWHPDGKHLVVVSERGGRSDLYLIDVPG